MTAGAAPGPSLMPVRSRFLPSGLELALIVPSRVSRAGVMTRRPGGVLRLMSAKIQRMVIATAILTAFALVCTTALLKSGEAQPDSTPPVQVGTFQRRTLMFGGQSREYDVLYPSAALEDTRLLVVFALHCYGCDITTVRKMQPAIVMAQRQLSACRCATSRHSRSCTASFWLSLRGTAIRGMHATAVEMPLPKKWTTSASSSLLKSRHRSAAFSLHSRTEMVSLAYLCNART